MTRLDLIISAVEFRISLMGERDDNLERDNPLEDVKRFCERYRVSFVGERTTHERGFRESMYFFDNGLGGYNIDAIRGSLKTDKIL